MGNVVSSVLPKLENKFPPLLHHLSFLSLQSPIFIEVKLIFKYPFTQVPLTIFLMELSTASSGFRLQKFAQLRGQMYEESSHVPTVISFGLE